MIFGLIWFDEVYRYYNNHHAPLKYDYKPEKILGRI